MGDSRDPQIESLIRGDHSDPFGFLGPHSDPEGKGLIIRAFLPQAGTARVVAGSGRTVRVMTRVHPDGLFTARIRRKQVFPYRLRITVGAEPVTLEDPYRFPLVLGETDVYLLAEGNHYRAYENLGAHPARLEGVPGTTFAVWAPNARRVSVVGDFNAWDGRRHPMRLRPECGVWELFLPGVEPGALYKYEIKTGAGAIQLKADPCGNRAEPPPGNASVVAEPRAEEVATVDRASLRKTRNGTGVPVSIYEVHLGSWRRVPEEGNRYLTYRELAETLPAYAKDLGFTHVEFMPVMEYPFDGSWGYQPVGMFAPTSRFGTPADFQALVDRCHAEGLGVLLDWVPAHFPDDPHGLAGFDGTHLYEHADPRAGKHQDWDTLIYNFGRREVANFLCASARYWVDRFGVDGLRVDAVASMLYLDYSRGAGEWIPNVHGGNENLEAIGFLKQLNGMMQTFAGGAVMIAEESTMWPGVSRPVTDGGLGFDYKWSLGWMHDTLAYLSRDPVHRRHHHDQFKNLLSYAFSEHFILPLSHDEVVHGKGSLLEKMPGDAWQRFANLRLCYAFLFTHPGKKLLFMGGEFAQDREWNHDRSLDWHLLEAPAHRGVRTLVRDLNRLYRELPALHQRDCDPGGFEWIDAEDRDNSVLSYLRRGRNPEDLVVCVVNFTPVVRSGYRVGVPGSGRYRPLLNTDTPEYGGSGLDAGGPLEAEPKPWHGRPFSIPLTLPPLAAVLMQPESRGDA